MKSNDDGNSKKSRRQDRKDGKFSQAESNEVRKAIEEYCAIKEISVSRLCSECDHKAELKGAWMEIAKCLPNRSVQSVYRHGLRQLHPFKRGAWSDEECQSLADWVQRLGKKWAQIQQKLNRSADACRDKYREMGDEYIKGRWNDHETQLLLKLIREHVQANPSTNIRELALIVKKAEDGGRKIPWLLISKRMEKRSRLSCFKKWQKLVNSEFQPSSSSSSQPPLNKDAVVVASNNTNDATKAVVEDSIMKPEQKSTITAMAVEPKAVTLHTVGATAGEAAAIAAGGVVMGNVVPSPAAAVITAPEEEPPTISDPENYDQILLTELANTEATRAKEVDWESFRLNNAKERWMQLMDEFESEQGGDGSGGGNELSLSEMAQAILDRKASAQRAAETVEAVDLPAV